MAFSAKPDVKAVMVFVEEIWNVFVDVKKVGSDHVFDESECMSRFQEVNLERQVDEAEMTDVERMLCRWSDDDLDLDNHDLDCSV